MSSKDEDSSKILNDYFWLHKLILKTCGISLNDQETLIYKIYSRCVLCLLAVLIFNEIYSIFLSRNDLLELAGVLAVSMSHFLGFFKLSTLWRNRVSIADALSTLHTGVFLPNPRRSGLLEKILIKRCITKVYTLTGVHFSTLVLTILNVIGSSLATKFKFDNCELWEMPWVPFRLFSITTTITYYTVYVYQTITLILFAGIIVTIDLLIVAVFVHIATQFHILANVIRRLVENNSASGSTSVDISEQYDLYLRRRLEGAAYYHQELIKLTDRFEDLLNMLSLAIFMGNCIILCLNMFLFTSGELELNQLISEFTYFVTVVIQIFLYCYFGNAITDASDAISFACYEADFVGTDVRFQKGLLLIMMRSQRPIVFTAGKFAKLSLTSFVAILRASYSYFMVIKTNSAEA